MIAYHVVTERPMYVGEQIIFDEKHHSGVYQRVYDKSVATALLEMLQNVLTGG